MTQVALTTDPAFGVNSLPVSPIVVTTETLSNDSPDGVLHIDTTQARVGETATVGVTATDPATGTTQTQSFTVTVVPNPGAGSLPEKLQPIASPASLGFTVNTPETFQLTGDPANSGASSGQTLTFQITTPPSHGTLSGLTQPTAAAPGTASIHYTPDPGYQGSDSFQFTVTSSGAGLTSKPATVTLTSPQVAGPTAQDVAQNVMLGSGPVTIQLAGASPESSQAFTYSIVVAPTQGTLSQLNATTGTVVYTPNPGAQGTDSFQYVVTDTGFPAPGLASQPATVALRLIPQSPSPSPTPTPTPSPAPTSTVSLGGVHLQKVKLTKKKTQQVVIVNFIGALDPVSAQNVNNYQLVELARGKNGSAHPGKTLRLTTAAYNPGTGAVTLTPAGQLPSMTLQLTISGTGMRDAAGVPVGNRGNGQSGKNFVTAFKG
jgi:hypothetical protein